MSDSSTSDQSSSESKTGIAEKRHFSRTSLSFYTKKRTQGSGVETEEQLPALSVQDQDGRLLQVIEVSPGSPDQLSSRNSTSSDISMASETGSQATTSPSPGLATEQFSGVLPVIKPSDGEDHGSQKETLSKEDDDCSGTDLDFTRSIIFSDTQPVTSMPGHEMIEMQNLPPQSSAMNFIWSTDLNQADSMTRQALGAPQINVISPSTVTHTAGRASLSDVESGESEHQSLSLLSWRSVWQYFLDIWQDRRRRHIFLIVSISVILVLLTIIFVPISLEFVEYDKIALPRNTITGNVDEDRTYYPGCYFLGPAVELLQFRSTAHFLEFYNLSTYTQSNLMVNVDVFAQYFIKPPELGELYETYARNYQEVIGLAAQANIKNTLSMFSKDELYLNRTIVEQQLHLQLFRELGGSCCLDCCTTNSCSSLPPAVCSTCDGNRTSCTRGFHVELRYVQLGFISLPANISRLLLRVVLLQTAAETESFNKTATLIREETLRQTNLVYNQANEVTEAAYAQSNLTNSLAKSDGSVLTETATSYGLNFTYSRLQLTDENHKMSLFMFNSFNKKSNLYFSTAFDENIIYV